ncbi:hypothetical protein E2P81_ATG05732 [Venturia nashicola]|nr:hypothetical protein E2P81_ATG05732 [Venturia nashicola]
MFPTLFVFATLLFFNAQQGLALPNPSSVISKTILAKVQPRQFPGLGQAPVANTTASIPDVAIASQPQNSKPQVSGVGGASPVPDPGNAVPAPGPGDAGMEEDSLSMTPSPNLGAPAKEESPITVPAPEKEAKKGEGQVASPAPADVGKKGEGQVASPAPADAGKKGEGQVVSPAPEDAGKKDEGQAAASTGKEMGSENKGGREKEDVEAKADGSDEEEDEDDDDDEDEDEFEVERDSESTELPGQDNKD